MTISLKNRFPAIEQEKMLEEKNRYVCKNLLLYGSFYDVYFTASTKEGPASKADIHGFSLIDDYPQTKPMYVPTDLKKDDPIFDAFMENLVLNIRRVWATREK